MDAESLSAKINAAYGMTKKSAHMRHICATRIQISSAGSQLVFGFLPADLVHVCGGDHAGRQGDDGDADEGGYHGDEPSQVRGGIDIAVSDSRYGNGRPVQGVKKALEKIRFQLENQHC